MREKVFSELRRINYGSVTTDIWTSNSLMSYLGVTFHYIDQHMFFHNKVLCLRYLEDEHSGRFIYEQLQIVLEEWLLSNKVLFI